MSLLAIFLVSMGASAQALPSGGSGLSIGGYFNAAVNLLAFDQYSVPGGEYLTGGKDAYSNVAVGDLTAEMGGAGVQIGSDMTSYDSSYLIAAKFQRFNVHLNLWNGLLYTAAGSMEDGAFTPSLAIAQTELAGVKLGKFINQYGGTANNFGAMIKSTPIKGLTLGVYVPLATRFYPGTKLIVDGADAYYVSTVPAPGKAYIQSMDPETAYQGTSVAAKYSIPGLGTLYGGFLGEQKEAYGAFSLGLPSLSKLSLSLGLTYDWNEAAGAFLPAYSYYLTGRAPSLKTSLTGAYSFNKTDSLSLDAIWNQGIDAAKNGAAYIPDARIEVTVSGTMKIHDILLGQLDVGAKMESGSAWYSDARKDFGLRDLFAYPHMILRPKTGLLVSDIDLGFKYGILGWSVPLSVKVYF